MDRVAKVSGTYNKSGVAQAERRQNGKSAAVQNNQEAQPHGADSALESFGGQNPAQQHFTEEQARAHYYAQQQDKGQYYAEQQLGERYHAERYHREKSSQYQYVTGKTEQESNSGQNTKYNYNAKEYSETGNSILDQLKRQSDAFKKVLDPENKKNLYDATMDLMLVEQAEKTAALKAIQTRLLFKIRSVKASGAKASVIRAAVNKIKKVISKVKGKIKNLKKEEQLERKRKKAEENKKKEKERQLREELERRKKVRKAKERNDIEESKMGLGANYGGPEEATPAEIAAMAYGSVGAASASSAEAGATVDVTVADVGAAADAGAVDLSL